MSITCTHLCEIQGHVLPMQVESPKLPAFTMQGISSQPLPSDLSDPEEVSWVS